MQDIFNFDLPPYVYLKQVLSHNPRCAETYVELWRQRDKKNRIVTKDLEIKSRFLMSSTKFRNDLLTLVKEGLVSVEEDARKMTIELVDYSQE